jgi:hypothetical protein
MAVRMALHTLDRIPDETSMMIYRHILNKRDLGEKIF